MIVDYKKLPEVAKEDKTHLKVRMLLATIPPLGGPALELFNEILPPPIEKRKREWMNSVAEALDEIFERLDGLSMESLQENPQFVSIITQATLLAMRNHNSEKIEALKNAVLNTAQGIDIDEYSQIIYVNSLETMTPLHLKILKYFNNPQEYLSSVGKTTGNLYMGGIGDVLEIAIPELANQRALYLPILQDMYMKGFLNTDRTGFGATMSMGGILAKRTTELGDAFLRYIGL